VLTDAFTLADRLNAKLLAAVGEHDTAELWRNDGATSMIAWRLFCDAGIHRVITDGRSSILDYGTTTRTVPANLFNALVIRDRHCRFPGCDRPPEWTETHHPDGSPTADPPPSTTSPSSAPATTTSSTHPAGTPNSSPTPPHRDHTRRPNTRGPAPQSATASTTVVTRSLARATMGSSSPDPSSPRS
jgi:hypothetical protein